MLNRVADLLVDRTRLRPGGGRWSQQTPNSTSCTLERVICGRPASGSEHVLPLLKPPFTIVWDRVADRVADRAARLEGCVAPALHPRPR